MNCWKCGAEIQEGRDRCLACYSPVRKPGFFSRLFKGLLPKVSVHVVKSQETFPGTGSPLIQFNVVTKQAFTFQDASGKKQTYRSLEEIPPEIRSKIEAAMPSAFRHLTAETNPATVNKLSENEEGRPSPDELPAEIRSQAEGAIEFSLQQTKTGTNDAGLFTSKSYTVREPDGQVRTYHALEEMPPGVRALFEKIRSKGLQ